MKDIPNEEQMAFLRKEIFEVNKLLPSNVYVPFLKDSVRNYIICHIPVTEMKIFRTKNRAPYMITVEVIRIDELINMLLRKEKLKLAINREISGNAIVNNMLPHDNSLNYSSYTPPKTRSYSMATSNLDHQNDNEIFLVNKKDIVERGSIKKQNAKTFLEIKKTQDNSNLIKKRSSTLRMLEESDIRLSRPVIISNLEADSKRTPLRGEKKIILEENEEYEESFIKEGMDEMVKRRLTIHPFSRDSKKILDGGVDQNLVKKSSFMSKQEQEQHDQQEKEKSDKELKQYLSRGRNHTTCEPIVNTNILIGEDENQCII